MAEKKTEKNGAPMGPGTSNIKDPEVYEALRREGASEEKAARIANASARDGRDEVAKRARELDIEGRSTMTKDELIEALRDLLTGARTRFRGRNPVLWERNTAGNRPQRGGAGGDSRRLWPIQVRME